MQCRKKVGLVDCIVNEPFSFLLMNRYFMRFADKKTLFRFAVLFVFRQQCIKNLCLFENRVHS